MEFLQEEPNKSQVVSVVGKKEGLVATSQANQQEGQGVASLHPESRQSIIQVIHWNQPMF